MSDTAFPCDKEHGGLKPQPIENRSDGEEEEDDEPPPTMRQTAFLLGLLWTSWLVAVVFDTILAVDKLAYSPARMSALQNYVWRNDWDLWVFRVSGGFDEPLNYL
jgi:hypothetical protein